MWALKKKKIQFKNTSQYLFRCVFIFQLSKITAHVSDTSNEKTDK